MVFTVFLGALALALHGMQVALGGRVVTFPADVPLATAQLVNGGVEVEQAGFASRDGEDANQPSLAEIPRQPAQRRRRAAADNSSKRVNFYFMTTDFKYPGHEPGVVGNVMEWFGGRSVSEVKEEIVAGHTCQKRGSREMTYYATSLCYWLPEISGQQTNKDPVLAWKGGAHGSSKAQTLCHGLAGSGVCVKCSVCHNNAIDEDGEVQSVQFTEQLTLPEGCLGEKEIESQCTTQFDKGSPDLKAEDTRCHEVQKRFDHATRELTECTSELRRLPGAIERDLPEDIERAQRLLYRKEGAADQAEVAEKAQLRNTRNGCYSYEWSWFSNRHEKSVDDYLRMRITCYRPWAPSYNEADQARYHEDQARYHEDLRRYHNCVECETAVGRLQQARRTNTMAKAHLANAQKQLAQAKDALRQAQQELQRWQSLQPSLTAEKEAMDKEWLPQESGCRATYSNYTTGMNKHVSACAPTHYDSSCERACLEEQAKHAGCGVLEGDQPGSVHARGGIEAKCAPPQPSWVMAPFTYGAKEAPGAQCARIGKVQSAQYAQRVMKSGWLWKQRSGVMGGWDKRYFVMEGSDQVRSAVLRYFKDDPSKISDPKESAGKGIILWDALSYKYRSGKSYRWRNGEQCFKIFHFYRDYRLCVPSDDNATSEQIEKDRHEWLWMSAQEMKFSPIRGAHRGFG